jgi:hypothetical protein
MKFKKTLDSIMSKAKYALAIPLVALAIDQAEAQMDITMQEQSIPSQKPVAAKFEVKGTVYGQSGSTMIDSTTGKGKVNVFSADYYVRQLKAINHFLMKDSVFINTNNNKDAYWELIEARPITSTYYNNILEEIEDLTSTRPTDANKIIGRFPTGNIPVHHVNRPANFKAAFDSMKTDLYNKTNGTITFTEDTTISSTGANILYVTAAQWPAEIPLEPGWTETTAINPDGTIKQTTTWILIGYGPNQTVMSREVGRIIGLVDGSKDPNMVMYHNAPATKFHPDEGKVIEDMYKLKIGTDMSKYQNKIVNDLTSVKIEKQTQPKEFELTQNYPNPFNPTTTIYYNLVKAPSLDKVNASLRVYDVLGREVAVLVNEEQPAGEYRVEFNASHLPSGVYFYRLSDGNYTATKKLVLMK